MLRSVFAKSIRDQRNGLLGWGIGIVASVALMGALWPSFADTDMSQLASQYPEALEELFDINAMSTGTGYFNAELFSILLPAMFIIYAVARGARTLAGEEEDGTLAMLLTMPLERNRVLLEKAAGLVLGVGVLAVVLWIATWLTSIAFDMEITIGSSAVGAFTQWLIGIEFGLLAMAIAAWTGRRSLAIGIPGTIAVASYVVFVASQLVASLNGLRWLSPFFAATTGGPLGGSVPMVAWTMPVVGIVALAVSMPVFRLRDIAD